MSEEIATTATKPLRARHDRRPELEPVEQPTEFHLVVNIAAARDIGLAVPEALLLRATRVIE